MINNRQNGRRGRGRGNNGMRPMNGGGGGQDRGNRIDNRARGNANQLHEKYKTLARDAQTAGDRVMTEYYLQFADHYFRVLSESRSRFEEQNPQARRQPGPGGWQDDYDGDEGDGDGGAGSDMGEQRYAEQQEPRFREEGERRPPRDDRGPREDRAPRENRAMRDDRPVRDDRTVRDERPVREERPVRDERPVREDRSQRFDRREATGEAQPVDDGGEQLREPQPRREEGEVRPRRGRPRREFTDDAPAAPATLDADRLPAFLVGNGETPMPPAANADGGAEEAAEVPRRRRVRRPRADDAGVAAEV